jgi:putative lipoic acid-binding regulatory protein
MSGLKDDKASFENKLVKLLATQYAEEAQYYIEQLNSSRGNYKGWEAVLEAYKAHISAIQSVIKFNLTGEIQANIVNKYGGT